jgi:hypothetical protein
LPSGTSGNDASIPGAGAAQQPNGADAPNGLRDHVSVARSSFGALWVMKNDSPEFEWYDAWVLAALIYAADGAAPVPLWRLVAVADALNKAIVSREELEFALARLDRAGYVRAVSDGVEVAPTALALQTPGPPVEHIARVIGAKPWSPQAEMPRTTDEAYVSADAYAKAVKKYRKEFWKEYRGSA